VGLRETSFSLIGVALPVTAANHAMGELNHIQ
jgi:hypothetical protein